MGDRVDVPDLAAERRQSVERDVAARGVVDDRVLAAMRAVRRECFVPRHLAELAYEDNPLPIGDGQTISQPYIVAHMAEAAEIAPGDRVLEIGTGSGYGAAVLAQLASQVWTIERYESLAEQATQNLRGQGVTNVHVVVGDGTVGCPRQAPFDAIIVTASAPDVPPALEAQLVDGGRLVLPVGPRHRVQSMLRVRRVGDDFRREDLGAVRFVPLIGEQGWSDSDSWFRRGRGSA